MFELFGYLWELESEGGEDDQSMIKKRINVPRRKVND